MRWAEHVARMGERIDLPIKTLRERDDLADPE